MAAKVKFEDAMARLQEIVARLEGGDEPLESAMKLFEEGSKLSALCYKRLDEAEQKLRQLGQPEEDGRDG